MRAMYGKFVIPQRGTLPNAPHIVYSSDTDFFQIPFHHMTHPAVLVLQDGTVYHGTALGHIGETLGEVCFNTSMTGYQEVLTDPSYHGQIVAMTYPHIGNYGVNAEDMESDRIRVAGFIVREACSIPSNHRAEHALTDWLREHGIVGIQGLDTRALTRRIRSQGAMNGIISSDGTPLDVLRERLAAQPSMAGLDLARMVSCGEPYRVSSAQQPPRFSVAALDFGIKRNILRLLADAGCEVTVYPAQTPVDVLLADHPDGVFLSNGPGDPSAVGYGIETVRELLGKRPLFGICLGHQLLALALGASTYKLPFGHRGGNHPVRNLERGTVEITSQNHGFAVDATTLPADCMVTHWNLNDNTLEGFRCNSIPAFSVQYHPEAAPGPHDSRYLFREFLSLMERHASS